MLWWHAGVDAGLQLRCSICGAVALSWPVGAKHLQPYVCHLAVGIT